ncbi:D-lactate dehydrogenase [Madurella fahalii]|uniref:D-lactate dehydrogenase n=1 Tax=Madurella fahalii TaxID=1157608 RepID=A0ABQ0FYU9_9PEZI
MSTDTTTAAARITKLAVFSAKPYDIEYLTRAHSTSNSRAAVELVFHDFPLNPETAPLARGADAVCVFVNDVLTAPVLTALHGGGVRAVLLRCAGYNNVDLGAAEGLGMRVAHVPAYAPEAVAEFAVALVQTLNRKTHRAYNRVREGNFELDGRLLGRTLRGRTVGVVGVGRIGLALARILGPGFGCRLLAYDPFPSDAFREFGEYKGLEEVLRESDVVSLHCPLTDATRHIINEKTLAMMKKGAMLVNTSRGGLIHTGAVINALKSKHLGGLALDVYEAEGGLFYHDHSADIIQDDQLMRLMTFPNVLVCGHQAFFTEEALIEIAECTMRNLEDFLQKVPCKNSLVEGSLLVRRDSVPVRI